MKKNSKQPKPEDIEVFISMILGYTAAFLTIVGVF